jgi:uncharacterized protein YndB with AHSA1/START domain
MSTRASRELRAETQIAATPQTVWEVVTDFKLMAQGSPELVAMVPLLPGGLRVGQNYLGINRRKAFVWPTRNVIREVSEDERLVWDTTSSGARWIYELEETATGGTRLVHRRPVPEGPSLLSPPTARIFLGGVDEHADELEEGMAATLARIKALAEATAPH